MVESGDGQNKKQAALSSTSEKPGLSGNWYFGSKPKVYPDSQQVQKMKDVWRAFLEKDRKKMKEEELREPESGSEDEEHD